MKEETRETGKCMAGTIMATEVEKRIFEHKCYEAYRLYWMLSHGNTLQELSGAINSLAAELVETDSVSAATDGDSTRRLMENAEQSFLCDSGFCWAVWANKEKFLSEEFCDPDYMKTLLSLRSDGDEMWKFYKAHYMPDSSGGKKPYTNQELFHVLCEQGQLLLTCVRSLENPADGSDRTSKLIRIQLTRLSPRRETGGGLPMTGRLSW